MTSDLSGSDSPAHPPKKETRGRLAVVWTLLILFGWPFVVAIIGALTVLPESASLLSFIYGGLVFIWLSPQFGLMLYFAFLALGLIAAIVLIVVNQGVDYRKPRKIAIILLIIMLIQAMYTVMVLAFMESAF